MVFATITTTNNTIYIASAFRIRPNIHPSSQSIASNLMLPHCLKMPRNILGRNGNGQALLCKTHLVSKGGVWLPCSRLAGCDLLQHLVDLFERQTLGLGHEEVCEEEGEAAEGAPEEEDLGAEVGVALLGADEVGSDDSDDLRSAISAGALQMQMGTRV